jgi:hypothetical protein
VWNHYIVTTSSGESGLFGSNNNLIGMRNVAAPGFVSFFNDFSREMILWILSLHSS